MNKPIPAGNFQHLAAAPDVARLVEEAGRIVPPLWPLQSAIAVNPLCSFEDRPFAEAVKDAARTFNARATLPLNSWRQLVENGRIDRSALRDVAITRLGGLEQAFALIGPNVSKLDLLLARLLDIEPRSQFEDEDRFAPADALIAKWCGAFFSQTSGSLMPGRRAGLYRAVIPLLSADRRLAEIVTDASPPGEFAEDPLREIEAGLRELGIPFHQWGAVLKKLVARLPGWAGHIRWRNEYAGRDLVEDAPASAADLLALWTFVLRSAPDRWTWRADELHVDATEELLGHFDIGADQRSLHAEGRCALREIGSLHEDDLGLMFMEAAERTFRGSIVQRIRGSASTSPADGRPTAQLVFCIDVRSEPFRRAIESQGTYETLGYAGFFGLPISLTSADGASSRNLLPVLLRPAHAVVKGPAVGQETRARKSWAKKLRRSSAQRIFDAIKNGIGTSFAAAEATGPLAAARMVESCVGPSLKSLSGRDESCFAPDRSRIPLSDQVDYARSLFSMTGLGTNLARLVVLVGHGSHAVNNPFASALDCGACGGHRGGENARLLAAILNDADVRKALAEDSVEIPADTVFVGAEHDTTRDFVRVFDTQLIPATHEQDLANLKADLSTAGDRCREERGQRLGRSARDLLVGSQHWGEVRPEWGLAGNAAFIVGPRELTKDANLEGRVFLHSYNWASDPTGAALEVILTAPMIVAQWINCQYLFSTVDNSRFGAGDKITHNVLGGIGVVQGNGGDLRVGLPRQSLYDDQGVPYHVPQRLLTIVEAPLDRLEEIIDRNAILQRLFGNGWVQLIAVEPNTGRFRCWRTVKEFAKPGLKIEEQEGETLGARLVDA